ncbi:hypothetical protein BDM02DRAFT_3106819 [Thelephora ganbajun]|uniref:Uncharacterized protein n=1 Tax=Thelephora ganbajun TaxID=370292 RepID=A0ACB6ZX71_THEGA|nr:hypothetical protein BDM02DRAFT_3106819 [Thelephora ganbajun]
MPGLSPFIDSATPSGWRPSASRNPPIAGHHPAPHFTASISRCYTRHINEISSPRIKRSHPKF